MKKIFTAVLLILFSITFCFNTSLAQPFNNNRHSVVHNSYHQSPKQQIFIRNKTVRTEKIAAGLLAGITGVVVLDKVINGSAVYTTPTTNNYYYTSAPQPTQHCVTTVSRYSGTTATTCSSQPQTHEVIYIN